MFRQVFLFLAILRIKGYNSVAPRTSRYIVEYIAAQSVNLVGFAVYLLNNVRHNNKSLPISVKIF